MNQPWRKSKDMVFYIIGQYGQRDIGLVDRLGKDPQEGLRGKAVNQRIGGNMIAVIPMQELGINAWAKGQEGQDKQREGEQYFLHAIKCKLNGIILSNYS